MPTEPTVHIRARVDLVERYRKLNKARNKGKPYVERGSIRDLTDAALEEALPALEKAEADAEKKANA